MNDVPNTVTSIAQAGKTMVGLTASILNVLGKHHFLSLTQKREKNMRDWQSLELELEEQRRKHSLKMEEAEAIARARIKMIESTADIAMEKVKNAISEGKDYRHALTDFDPETARAVHNLFVDTLNREYAKERIGLYSLREAARDPDATIDTSSEKKTSESWFTRFWSYAENMRDDELQERWGKVLANEVRRPGSISLKALDILYTLDTRDALNFEKIVPYVLNDDFILDECFEHEKISYLSIATLESIGIIIRQTTKKFTGLFAGINWSTRKVINGIPENGIDFASSFTFRCCLLTPSGRELSRLVTVSEEQNKSAMKFLVQTVQQHYPALRVTLSEMTQTQQFVSPCPRA